METEKNANNLYLRDADSNAIILKNREEYQKAEAEKKRRNKIRKLSDNNDQLKIITSLMMRKIEKLEKELSETKKEKENG